MKYQFCYSFFSAPFGRSVKGLFSQSKGVFFCCFFFSFLLALALSQVQRSQCLVEAYVFWHTFSVSVNYARTRTYSTVGMRFWDGKS